MKAHLYVACVSVLTNISLAFTTVAIIKGPTTVAIATDSLEIGRDGTHEAACKIRTGNGVYFAAAGFGRDSEHFDIFNSLVPKFLRGKSSIHQRAQSFAEEANLQLFPALQRVHHFFPDGYKALTDIPLTVAFVGIEEKVPIVVIVHFQVINSPQGVPLRMAPPKFQSCPGNACSDPLPNASKPFFVFGVFDAFRMKSTVGLFKLTGDDAGDVVRIVQMEIAHSPSLVGPPISALLLDASGEHWRSRGVCTATSPLKRSAPH